MKNEEEGKKMFFVPSLFDSVFGPPFITGRASLHYLLIVVAIGMVIPFTVKKRLPNFSYSHLTFSYSLNLFIKNVVN